MVTQSTSAQMRSVSPCIPEYTGMDPVAVTPTAPKMRKLIQAAMIVIAGATVSSLVALFVVALQSRNPIPEEPPSFQDSEAMFLEDNTTEQLPVEPNNHYHFGGRQEFQEAIQTLKSHIDNSSTWYVEIQTLKRRVDNVSCQVQGLEGYLGDTSADIQRVKGALQKASALSVQTQMLGSSLEGASAEIQKLKGDLEKANALTFQTQDFLKNISENTSTELRMLSRGLGNVNTEIQMLNAGLEMVNTQARLTNSSLKNANSEIHALRGRLDSFNDLRTQNQVLSSSLEGAQAEIQKLGRSLQNANALNSQTQARLKGSLDNTSAEILALRGHLEMTGNEMHLLKRDLETVTAQTQLANGHLEQADAQIQMLKAELGNANTLNSQIQVLNGQLNNASREIQTLKQRVKDTAALDSQMQMLGSNLQKASAEMQRLKEDLESTKTLTVKIQEEQSRLGTLRAAIASQEQLQRTQNQLLQLILQGWKVFEGNLYYFSHVKKSWHEAEQFCVSRGAHLTSVTSQREQAFLVQFTSTSYHWIGLTDRGTEGSWRWTDGTPFSNTQSRGFWDKNQPDNWQHGSGDTEDCVHIQKKWNDISCNASYHWICKKSTGQAVA
ncbi:PREDICTED: C-type lectin domain family 4 member F isoform X2 [Chinchilla lanigera]|uniref:C-type lectin domain family 4 member F isoform X2 n=1 Tax=Chinchilla lanigera TaxID=34839 RepID=UPI0006986B7A|nr:PREDICTED: C-type lectin domain family 4 member F isoform X2 [Chinchilla lanigera]